MKNKKNMRLFLIVLFSLVAITGAVFIVVCARGMVFGNVTTLKILGVVALAVAFVISTISAGVLFNYYKVDSSKLLNDTNDVDDDKNNQKSE